MFELFPKCCPAILMAILNFSIKYIYLVYSVKESDIQFCKKSFPVILPVPVMMISRLWTKKWSQRFARLEAMVLAKTFTMLMKQSTSVVTTDSQPVQVPVFYSPPDWSAKLLPARPSLIPVTVRCHCSLPHWSAR